MNSTSHNNKDFVFDYSSYTEFNSILDLGDDNNMDKYKSPFTYNKSEKYTTLKIEEEKASPEGVFLYWLRVILARLCLGMVIASFPVSAFWCLKRVSPLHRMVVMRLGRLQPIRGPGLVIVLPGLDKYVMVDLAPKTLQIEPLQVLTSDGGILSLAGVAEYRVIDVVGYVMRSRHLEATLTQLLKTSLTTKAASAEQSDLLERRDCLLHEIKVDVNSLVQLWGGEVVTFHLTTVQVLQSAQPKDPLSPLLNSLASMLRPPAPPTCDAQTPESSVGVWAGNPLETWLQKLAQNKPQLEQIAASFYLNLSPDPGFLVHLDHGDVTVSPLDPKDVIPPVDATLTLTMDTLNSLVSENLSAKDAYMEGKLHIEGASGINPGLVTLFL